MINPAFLVEGSLEKKFIENACPGSTVRSVIPNGIKVTLDAIAERIATHYRLLEKRHSPIVVVLDREGREMQWDEMKRQILIKLKGHGITSIEIGICDRKIENWIIADAELFPEISNEDVSVIEGKRAIKMKLGEYHETTIGVELLKKANPINIKHRSPSFSDFYDTISNRIKCWWLRNAVSGQ